jgi:hypothetical protein
LISKNNYAFHDWRILETVVNAKTRTSCTVKLSPAFMPAGARPHMAFVPNVLHCLGLFYSNLNFT